MTQVSDVAPGPLVNFLLTTPLIVFKLDMVLNTFGIEMVEEFNLPFSVYLNY
jgi:hypothetical protein